jgi:hypothetical protein
MKMKIPWNGVKDPSKTVRDDVKRAMSPSMSLRQLKSKGESRNTQFVRKELTTTNLSKN